MNVAVIGGFCAAGTAALLGGTSSMGCLLPTSDACFHFTAITCLIRIKRRRGAEDYARGKGWGYSHRANEPFLGGESA